MKAYAVDPAQAAPEDIVGRVLAHTVRRPTGKGILFRKGQLLTADDLPQVRQASGELHLLEPEPGELHEDEAGGRLARAAAADGIVLSGPTESQYQLVAARRGLGPVAAALLPGRDPRLGDARAAAGARVSDPPLYNRRVATAHRGESATETGQRPDAAYASGCDGRGMTRIVILGAGTGGTLTANRLRRAYGDDTEIVVVDRDDRHVRR